MGNAPDIRFKGFSGDWEKRKLDDWGTFYYGRSCPKWSVTENATIPCIRYGELYTKFGAKIDKVYSYTSMSPKDLRFSQGTEVLIPRVGEDPMDYNHCSWLSVPNVAIGEMISVFNTENNPLFTATMFNATLQKEFAMRVEGGSVTNLYFEKLKNIDVSFPSIDEQERTASYFEILDHLIDLHQRKCDEMSELKKYMLQKMFPKKGEQFPEIRFSGFTEPWEQRKVTELGEIYIGLVTTMTSHYTDHGVLLIRNSDIKDNKFEFSNDPIYLDDDFAKQNASRQHRIGDVITVHTGDIGTSAVITEKEVGSIGFATIVTRPYEDKITSEYLCAYLNSDKHKQFAMNISTGDGRNNYNLKDYYECVVPVPSIAEQIKISECVNNLNNLLIHHQRKCGELKEFKKYMLQNMFPKKG